MRDGTFQTHVVVDEDDSPGLARQLEFLQRLAQHLRRHGHAVLVLRSHEPLALEAVELRLQVLRQLREVQTVLGIDHVQAGARVDAVAGLVLRGGDDAGRPAVERHVAGICAREGVSALPSRSIIAAEWRHLQKKPNTWRGR